MGGQRPAPRSVERLVDHLEQRPDHRIRRPRILVGGAGDFGDQRVRVAERDAGADAVGTVPAAEDVRQPLAQPPLDTTRGDEHELLGEWVGQRIGQQCAKAVSKQVGALGTVEVEGHRPQR